VATREQVRKHQELTDPRSCMSRAVDDEMTFVLLGRDAAAPEAIRAWCGIRIRLGKNGPRDPQIIEAMECAEQMERDRANTNG
jgi:hypothetical protein